MSARRAGDGSAGGGGGRAGVTALLLVAVAVGMMLLANATPTAEPFDPRSGDPSGTRGLALLLERQGAQLDIGYTAPAPGDDRRVLVLRANLNDDQQAGLRRFVAAGGVVVWADPAGDPLGRGRATTEIEQPLFFPDSSTETNVDLGDCSMASLSHLRGLWVPSGVLFDGDDAPQCFADGDGAFVVAEAQGDGWVVRLGDNEPFTNRYLRYADNAPLATALLVPSEGARITILLGSGPAVAASEPQITEERSLFGLVRPGVWMALAQLRLMHRARHAGRAGAWLRHHAYRTLCEEHHLPSTTSVEALDAAVSARSGIPAGRVAEVLSREVYDPAGLIQLGNDLHSLHEGADT